MVKGGKKATEKLTLIALFSAVLSVSAMISLPFPGGTAITLQTLAVALCGYTLGASLGLSAVAVYLLIGLAGMPVFSLFSGGMAVLFGKNGGFLLGFLPMVWILGMSKKAKGPFLRPFLGVLALALCHALGIIQFSVVAGVGLPISAAGVSLPFLLKDLLCVFMGYKISEKLKDISKL